MQNGQEAECGPDFFDSCLSFCDNSSVLLCQDPLDRKVTKCKGTNTGRDRSLNQCPARQCLLGWTLIQDSSAPAAEQTEKAFQENPIACLLCQQLPPAQAEPLEPRDVPASAPSTGTASCSGPSLLLLAQPRAGPLLRGASACALTEFQHPSFPREALPFM